MKCLSVAGALAALACGSGAREGEDAFTRALELQADGALREAYIEARQALRNRPLDVETNRLVAELSASNGRLADAVFYYGEVLRLDPARPDARLARAELLARDAPEEGLAEVRTLLAADPEQAGAHALLARLLLLRGDAASALQAAREARARADGYQENQTLGAAILLELRQALPLTEGQASLVGEAEEAFARADALASEGDRWQPRLGLAQVAALADRPDTIDAFRHALAAAREAPPGAVVAVTSTAYLHAVASENAVLRRESLATLLASESLAIGWRQIARLEEATEGPAAAETFFERSRKQRPDDVTLAIESAQWKLRAGRLDEAEAELLKLREAAPRDLRPAERLAELWLTTGRFEEVAALTEDLSRERPGSLPVARMRARIALATGKAAAELPKLRTAAGDHDDGELWRLLALAENALGNADAARRSVAAARRAAPDSARVAATGARILHGLDGCEAGLPLLAEVHRAQELAVSDLVLLGTCLAENGDDEAAQRIFEWVESIERPPEAVVLALARYGAQARWTEEPATAGPLGPTAWARLAARALAAEKPAEALAWLDSVEEEADPSGLFVRMRAEALRGVGRPAEAIRMLEARLGRHPDDGETALGLAALRREAGDVPRALETLLAVEPRLTGRGRLALAQLLIEADRMAPAMAQLERIVQERGPEADVAANNLAWLHLHERGSPSEARPYAEQAAKALADTPEVQHTLGVVLMHERDWYGAEQALARAVEMATNRGLDRPQYAYDLGVARRGSQRNRAALEAFELALQIDPSLVERTDIAAQIQGAREGRPLRPIGR